MTPAKRLGVGLVLAVVALAGVWAFQMLNASITARADRVAESVGSVLEKAHDVGWWCANDGQALEACQAAFRRRINGRRN